jgi:uncharacterized protein YjbI with pentapeptide repeats
MIEKQMIENADITGSVFRHVNMSGSTFEDVNLSGARFFNANLRGATVGAIDFGGASFSCMNTGEDRPKTAADFKNIELDDCTFQECCFRGVKLVNCDVRGMTIQGIALADLIKAYRDSTGK